MALFELRSVSRHYTLPRKSLLSPKPVLKAVSDVSLTLEQGQTVGIVGESGSGKSTLARMAMGFERPDTGEVLLEGEDINALHSRQLRRRRPRFQMVFQDPFSSLDPRKTVGWSVGEPLLQDRCTNADHVRQRVCETLEKVGLRGEDANRYPHMFSGGQRQRIAIARAVITRPALLVADEPVSALDVSMQAQVLNLLMGMQDDLDLGILLISHDLAVISAMCDKVAVMSRGRIVEKGDLGPVLGNPSHAVTRELVTTSGAAA